jgi:hypothetical protein
MYIENKISGTQTSSTEKVDVKPKLYASVKNAKKQNMLDIQYEINEDKKSFEILYVIKKEIVYMKIKKQNGAIFDQGVINSKTAHKKYHAGPFTSNKSL